MFWWTKDVEMSRVLWVDVERNRKEKQRESEVYEGPHGSECEKFAGGTIQNLNTSEPNCVVAVPTSHLNDFDGESARFNRFVGDLKRREGTRDLKMHG